MELAGRMGYARVLVEVDAQQGLPDKVEVVYRKANNAHTIIKHVSVEYSWKPYLCDQCKVFGHSNLKCKIKIIKSCICRDEKVLNNDKNINNKENKNGFVEIKFRRMVK